MILVALVLFEKLSVCLCRVVWLILFFKARANDFEKSWTLGTYTGILQGIGIAVLAHLFVRLW